MFKNKTELWKTKNNLFIFVASHHKNLNYNMNFERRKKLRFTSVPKCFESKLRINSKKIKFTYDDSKDFECRKTNTKPLRKWLIVKYADPNPRCQAYSDERCDYVNLATILPHGEQYINNNNLV